MQLTINEIRTAFEAEFSPITGKFHISMLQGPEWHEMQDYIWHPGVYVWYHKSMQRVIKVGRHLENARKRALEHIRDNTNNIGKAYVKEGEEYSMQDIRDTDSDKVVLILFNVRDTSDYHWVAAVEIYLENVLNPLIRAGRQG